MSTAFLGMGLDVYAGYSLAAAAVLPLFARPGETLAAFAAATLHAPRHHSDLHRLNDAAMHCRAVDMRMIR